MRHRLLVLSLLLLALPPLSLAQIAVTDSAQLVEMVKQFQQQINMYREMIEQSKRQVEQITNQLQQIASCRHDGPARRPESPDAGSQQYGGPAHPQ